MLGVAVLLALLGVTGAAQPGDGEPLPVRSEALAGDKASTLGDAPLTSDEKQRVLAHKKSMKPPPPEPPEVWESGIFEDSEIPMSSMVVSVTNRWQRDIDETHYAVYAGSSGTEKMRGARRALVVRYLRSYDFEKEDMTFVEAKGVTGALRVEEELDGPVLRLRAEDGRALYFDPLKAKFVSRP